MDSHSSAMTINDGPLAGWDIAITHIPHGVDAMDDLCTLEMWPPSAGHSAHSFQTYRYAYGWDVIQAAVPGGDAQMQAALDWWTANSDSPEYAVHRILVAIDETTWATRDEIAERLGLTVDDLDPAKPYGQALATAEQHQLVTWRNRRATPVGALTPTGYDLIRPDEPQALATKQHLLDLIRSATRADQHTVPGDAAPSAPTVARAFRKLQEVTPQATTPEVAPLPPAGQAPSTRTTR